MSAMKKYPADDLLLLDNAMKYSSEQGIIRIALKTSGKSKIITVWNTTDQIEKGKLDLLFERFYRMDASHNSRTGALESDFPSCMRS